jgi:L-ascorbate metabolism protein UlaG (beta-lactamase superfamily)
MKNPVSKISRFLFISLILCSLYNNSVNAKEVRITYLQHDGFIIQADNRTFYFDITTKPSDTLPFPDVIFITHIHDDHYVKSVVVNLAKKSGAKVAGPPPVISSLSGSLPDTQLITYSPSERTKISGSISGINLTIYGSYTDQNSYRFEFSSGVILFFNGDMPASIFEQLVSNHGCSELLNMNIVMLDEWAYNMADFYANYKPDVLIKMHMWSAACVVFTDYPDSSELNSGNTYIYNYSNSVNDNPVSDKKILVFPNPSSKFVSILFPNTNNKQFSLKIFNANGQIMQNIDNITNTELKVDHTNWEKGLYFYKLQGINGEIFSGKFIKE